MNPHRAHRVPHRQALVLRVALIACAGGLLCGCASRTPAPAPVEAVQRTPPPAGLAATRTGAWRITQQRIGGEPTFLVVAEEPPPTRKTLAASDSLIAPVLQTVAPVALSDRATEGSRIPHTAPARLRKPVGSVYFAAAVSRLGAAASPIVAAAAASAGRTDRLVLTAYTDPYGSPELNRRLADLRAESVTAALGARGVDPAQVIVLSCPQCCARQSLAERDPAPYRRVDIEILTHRAVRSEERGDGTPHHS